MVRRLRGDVVVRRAFEIAVVLIVLVRVGLLIVGARETRDLEAFGRSDTEGTFVYDPPLVQLQYSLLLVVALMVAVGLLARARVPARLVWSIGALAAAYVIAGCSGPASWVADPSLALIVPTPEASRYLTMLGIELGLGALFVVVAVLVERADRASHVTFPQIVAED